MSWLRAVFIMRWWSTVCCGSFKSFYWDIASLFFFVFSNCKCPHCEAYRGMSMVMSMVWCPIGTSPLNQNIYIVIGVLGQFRGLCSGRVFWCNKMVIVNCDWLMNFIIAVVVANGCFLLRRIPGDWSCGIWLCAIRSYLFHLLSLRFPPPSCCWSIFWIYCVFIGRQWWMKILWFIRLLSLFVLFFVWFCHRFKAVLAATAEESVHIRCCNECRFQWIISTVFATRCWTGNHSDWMHINFVLAPRAGIVIFRHVPAVFLIILLTDSN